MYEWWRPELIWPVLAALAAGSLIGIERSFRSRPAGFRTHALVCMAAAMLMVAAVHQMEWMGPNATEAVIRIDPTRMAHGILTGVGFLCGGVIFREGFSVHGMTTAASLWVTSALGVLYGVGFYELAVPATVLTMAVVAGFRIIDDRLPQRQIGDLRVLYRREEALTEQGLRDFLGRVQIAHVGHRLTGEGRYVEHTATFRAFGRINTSRMVEKLSALPGVVEFDLQPRRD
jgi:putative Mg2+ transporter-C (MgtC) family protein